MYSFLNVLKLYAVFTGRAARYEFWEFILLNFLCTIIFGIIDVMLGTSGFLLVAYVLAVLCPGLAVSARRLHDTNRSGWWLLAGLIPIAGQIALIILLMKKGSIGQNLFGPEPRNLDL